MLPSKGSITGKVLHYLDNTPVADAVVETVPATISVTTDMQGVFTINDVISGSYKVIVAKSGLNTASSIISVEAGKTTSLAILLGSPPAPPQIISPANGTIDLPTTLTLGWDSSAGASNYKLQVSTSNAFTSFVVNDSNLTHTNFQISELLNLTTYWWRVIAVNKYGESNPSSASRFTTIMAATPPTLSSFSITNITQTSAVGGGEVISQGSAEVTARGVCWSTSQNPTIANSKTVDGSGTGIFTSSITGLTVFTTYYVRAYATNGAGTNYGIQESFSSLAMGAPCPSDPMLTFSGKNYNTVQIETQCWLKENLDVGIMLQAKEEQTNNGSIEKYCYENFAANCNTYGGLYQWSEAMQYSLTPGTKGICPTGWHIPTLAEFETLKSAVINNGNSLKAIGQGTGTGAGTNITGFSALLAGYRSTNSSFGYLSSFSFFWSSTQFSSSYAYYLHLFYDDQEIILNHDYYKTLGFSIRCLKD